MLITSKNSIRSCFFLLAFSLGIYFACLDCNSLASILCFQNHPSNETDKTLVSGCVGSSCYITSQSFADTEGDFCCQQNKCNYERNGVYGNQASKIKIHNMGLLLTCSIPIQKSTQRDLFPDLYKTIKTPPIYILIQSILC